MPALQGNTAKVFRGTKGEVQAAGQVPPTKKEFPQASVRFGTGAWGKFFGEVGLGGGGLLCEKF